MSTNFTHHPRRTTAVKTACAFMFGTLLSTTLVGAEVTGEDSAESLACPRGRTRRMVEVSETAPFGNVSQIVERDI